MADSLNIGKNWPTDQRKKLQQMLNQYGFTDDNGNTLAADGILGPRSMQAFQKMNTYQQNLKTPSEQTRQWQTHLNNLGYKDKNGNPLKEDGVHGPKTDAAVNSFDNNILNGLTDGKSQLKTVQTKVFPPMPGMTNADIAAKTKTNKNTGISYIQMKQNSAINDENNIQRNENMLYNSAINTNKLPANESCIPSQKHSTDFESYTPSDLSDSAEGLYIDYVSPKTSNTPNNLKGSAEGLYKGYEPTFDTPEEAAYDFAQKAMPLTDKNNKEYSAVMTTVQVPEYRDGQKIMITKYKYGDIMPGEHNNVVINALFGLSTPTEGQKYLLHTHPDSEYSNGTIDDPDHFSGAPYNPFDFGDASIPTIAGSQWYDLPQILNILSKIGSFGKSPSMSGYDGIYLCSPTGKLYYYEGRGNGDYQANTKDELQNKIYNKSIKSDFPKTTGHWNFSTGEFTPYKK